MVKSSDKSHFKLSLSAINARGYIINAKDSAHHRFFTANEPQSLPTLFEAWIEAVTLNSITRRTPSRMADVLLSSQPADFRDSQYRLAGARFYVEDVSSDSAFYILVYDCPLVYTRMRPVATEPSSACNEYPNVEVSLMPARAKMLLDCGELFRSDTSSFIQPTDTTLSDRFTKLVPATLCKDKRHRNSPNHGSSVASTC